MRLKKLRPIGRYTNLTTGQTANIHKGQRADGGVGEIYFYLTRGRRTIIPVHELHQHWRLVASQEQG